MADRWGGQREAGFGISWDWDRGEEEKERERRDSTSEKSGGQGGVAHM